jgi:molecular chaperone DnaJ
MFSGGGGRGRKSVNHGSNLRVKVKLTLEEIAQGVEKKIKVNKYIKCDTCKGTGAKGGSAYSTCSTCHGTGHVTRVTSTFLGQMQTTSTLSLSVVEKDRSSRINAWNVPGTASSKVKK